MNTSPAFSPGRRSARPLSEKAAVIIEKKRERSGLRSLLRPKRTLNSPNVWP